MASPERRKKIEESLSDKVRKNLEIFLSRSDDPGERLSLSEREKLIKESMVDPEAEEKLKKDKENKYGTNSLFGAMGWAEQFLSSEDSENVPASQKIKLSQRIEGVRKRIETEKPAGYSKELVDEVSDIANEVKKYL